MLRKHVIPPGSSGLPSGRGGGTAGLDIASLATVLVTSESSEHPVDHLFDGRNGPGGTRWVASTEGEQTLVLVFDVPQTIREEAVASRTQVTTLAVSKDGGQSYQEVVRQEFNFSAPGTTFEREVWNVPAAGMTNLRVTVQPDKGGRSSSRATLTSLSLH